MLKSVTLTISCVVVSILLSSCGSKMSIYKRHYTKGYYIDYNNNNRGVNAIKADNKAVHSNSIETAYASEEKGKIYVLSEHPGLHTINNKDIVVPVPDKMITRNVVSEQRAAEVRNIKINTRLHSVTQTRQNLAQHKISNNYPSGVVLSLLWLLVVGVLILWLIGYLIIGSGLIHILLVIALVLFVLWLLRII